MTISKDSSAPLLVVVGATGAQGGSVIKALAESDKPYRIRAFSRDLNKPASQTLASNGVEVVAYDQQTATLEETTKHFQGAHYVFAVTIPAVKANKQAELAEGKRYVDAVKAAGVSLFIWSDLPNVNKGSGGKYTHADHFDAKAEVTDYAMEVGAPVITVQAGGYMQNYCKGFFAPRKQADGSFVIASLGPPSTQFPIIDTEEDYGLFVRKAIEKRGKEEKVIYAYAETIALGDLAKQWGEVTGQRIAYVELSEEQFAKGITSAGLPSSVGSMFNDSFHYLIEFGFWGDKDIAESLNGLARKPRTWREYVKAADWSHVLK